MKKIPLILPLLISCTSPYQKAILEDCDQYSVLNQQEFMVTRALYSTLRNDPSLDSPVTYLARKNTIFRILSKKRVKSPNLEIIASWYYIQNIDNSMEKGWSLAWESQISPNVYNAKALSSIPK